MILRYATGLHRAWITRHILLMLALDCIVDFVCPVELTIIIHYPCFVKFEHEQFSINVASLV